MQILIPVKRSDGEDRKLKEDQFVQLQQLVDSKRQLLLDKQRHLQIVSKENTFLEDIKDDYSKYYNYIIKQKQDQIVALSVLDNYIKDLTVSNKLSKQNVKDARYEQTKILSEMDTIKKNLDSIISPPSLAGQKEK